VPIVFEGLAEAEVPLDRIDARIVGIPGSWDLANSLDLALQLQPDTQRVVVINGVSTRERLLVGSVPERARRLEPGLTFTWLTRHSMAELKAAVATLGPKTVVLFASLMEDAAGAVRVPRDALEEIAQVSTAPIYGPFESFIGHGIVGSTVETWHDTGFEAGRLVRHILDGVDPQAAAAGRRMPVSTIVDWRQVERWGLTAASFPPGTVQRFREPSLWQSHRTLVLVFAAIGTTQLVLIAALAITLRRRRLAEATRIEAQQRAARLRDELAHATRVNTLGELAATIAHEINQPLAAILSNAQAARRWLQREPPELGEVRACVDDVISDDKRAGEIIQRLRGLLMKASVPARRVSLTRVIREVSALLHGEMVANRVSVRLDLPPADVVVDGSEVEIQQVLLNLMLNAIQAMRETAGARTLEVTLRADGPAARVLVRDTGPGVPAHVRARVFEPFFTTKTNGLGMGLPICRRIADAHGGSLEFVESAPPGSAFALRLPIATGPLP
jgi:signal transduction histidine kinase